MNDGPRPARTQPPWFLAALLLAHPWTALASDPSADAGGERLETVVLLIGFVVAAYLLTHYVVDQLQRRLLFVTGIEYVVLGVLLGPAVPRIHAFDDLTALAPVIAVAAGWVGLVHGMEIGIRQLAELRDSALRVALIQSLVTGIVVVVTGHWLLASGWLIDVSTRDAWLAAGMLGAAAIARSTSAIDLIGRRYASNGTLRLLERVIRYDDALAICLVGVLFCVFHTGATATVRPPVASDWLLVSVGLGGALGVLFTAFLGDDESENNRFLALVGIITFASGAAFFLHLSLLLVNLVLGVVLVNTSRRGDAIRQTLAGTARPITLVLLVFGGALLRPVPLLPAVVVSVGYIAVRTATNVVGTRLATLGTPLRSDLSRGLTAQGNVAMAIGLSMQLVYDGVAMDLAYAAIVTSVLVHEFVAPRLLKRLMLDAGEIRDETAPNGDVHTVGA